MFAHFADTAHPTSTLSTPTPTTACMSTSTSSPPSIHMQSSYALEISDELLCELCNIQVNG